MDFDQSDLKSVISKDNYANNTPTSSRRSNQHTSDPSTGAQPSSLYPVTPEYIRGQTHEQLPRTPTAAAENNQTARQIQSLSSHQKRLEDQASKYRALLERSSDGQNKSSSLSRQSPSIQSSHKSNSLARWGVVSARTATPIISPLPQVISPFRDGGTDNFGSSQHVFTHVDEYAKKLPVWTKVSTTSPLQSRGSYGSTSVREQGRDAGSEAGGEVNSEYNNGIGEASRPEDISLMRKRKRPREDGYDIAHRNEHRVEHHKPSMFISFHKNNIVEGMNIQDNSGITSLTEASRVYDTSTVLSSSTFLRPEVNGHSLENQKLSSIKPSNDINAFRPENFNTTDRQNLDDVSMESKSCIIVLKIPPRFNSIWEKLTLRSQRNGNKQKYKLFTISHCDFRPRTVPVVHEGTVFINQPFAHVPTHQPVLAAVQRIEEATVSQSNPMEAQVDDYETDLNDIENRVSEYIIYDAFDDNTDVESAIAAWMKRGIATNKIVLQHLTSNASEERREDKLLRNPYLSRDSRCFLQEIDDSGFFCGYDLIHVPFDEDEERMIWFMIKTIHSENEAFAHLEERDFLDFLARRLQISPESLTETVETIYMFALIIVPYLEYRTQDDLARFIIDSINDYEESSLALACAPKIVKKSITRWADVLLQRQLGISTADSNMMIESHMLKMLQPYKHFEEGSSDVIDIAWSKDSDKFALACTALTDPYSSQYNRSGNLIFGYVDKGQVRPLADHWTRRETSLNVLDPKLYSTVSRVEFSGDVMLSASYDQTVKIWDLNGRLLDGYAFPSEVISLSCNSSHNQVFAVGLKNGIVSVSRTDTRVNQQMRAQIGRNLEPISLVWNSRGHLYVGYDGPEGGHQGDLKVFDAQTEKELCNVRPAAYRHFDICLDPDETILVAGVGVGLGKRQEGVNSHIRLFDLIRKPHPYMVIELDSPQRDLNQVTTSQCGRFVTSSATDGTTLIWDLRNPDHILHTLAHGEPKMPQAIHGAQEIHENAGLYQDAGVRFSAWYSDLFVTGSSDGVVKVWNPRHGDPFCYDLASFDSPIMSGAFSPDNSNLMVGLATGRATMLSLLGDGSTSAFDVDNYAVRPSIVSIERGSRQAALDLVNSGRVVLREAFDGRMHAFGV